MIIGNSQQLHTHHFLLMQATKLPEVLFLSNPTCYVALGQKDIGMARRQANSHTVSNIHVLKVILMNRNSENTQNFSNKSFHSPALRLRWTGCTVLLLHWSIVIQKAFVLPFSNGALLISGFFLPPFFLANSNISL